MFPYYKQSESNDCGPACLKMIVKFYEKDIALQTLRELCHIEREGVSIKALINAAEKIGFKSIGVKLLIDERRAEAASYPLLSDTPLPFIALCKNNHFVVVYAHEGNTVHLADPARGLIRMSKEELKALLYPPNDYAKVVLLEPTPDFQKQDNVYFENNTLSTQLKYLKKHVRNGKKQLIVLGAVILLKLGFQLLSPYLTQQTFDNGILQKNLQLLLIILIAQTAIAFIGSLLNYSESIVSNKIARAFNYSITGDFIRKLFRIPLTYFQQKKTSDFIHRIYDLSKIESFLTYNFTSFLLSCLSVAALSAMMIYYNVLVFLFFLVYTGIYGWYTTYTLRKKRELNAEKFDIQVSIHNYITEIIEGIYEIKLNGNARSKMNRIMDAQKKFFTNDLENTKVGQRLSIGTGLINNLGLGFINFYTAYLAIVGKISVGEMAAAQLIIVQLNSAVSSVYSSLTLTQEVKFSLERILEIESMKDEQTGTLHPQDATNVCFRQVDFAYSELSPAVLHQITLTIQRNATTAIVGTSGSGKTTLMKLALGFYKPSNGSILLNDQAMDEINLDQWRKKCGVVMQDSYVFSDSIRNNITESDAAIDEKRYLAALKDAELFEFVNSLPIQHDTLIGKAGLALSSGQRQRILLARLFYKNPSYVFLDEATNSLDAETEHRIMENLQRKMGSKTKLIIAHRLNTVRNADNIIVLKDGRIVEQGTHHQLLAQEGIYHHLVKEQLELA